MHPFRTAIEAGDLDAAVALLAEDVTFRSPVAFRSYRGRATVEPLLRAVATVFEDFRYTREISSSDATDHALVFHARVDGRQVEGCDFLHANDDGSIDELAVMVRPLSATIALAEAMGARLTPTLPYLDEHAIRIAAPRRVVWMALQRSTVSTLGIASGNPLGAILGTSPRAGFKVSESVPAERLTFIGRHRFAHYLLRFELSETTDGATQLRAQTYAAFPGVPGRIYRALVVGSGAHVIATNHILRAVRPLSLELAATLERSEPTGGRRDDGVVYLPSR